MRAHTKARTDEHALHMHAHTHARTRRQYPWGHPRLLLQYPSSTLEYPRYSLGTIFVHLVTPRVPRQYPCSPSRYPKYPPSTPLAAECPLENPRLSPVRTSVGAHPHIHQLRGSSLVDPAADDVDGAGGVDHGRVQNSRTPRRAGGTTRPRHTFGHAHVAVRPSRLSYKYCRSPPCDESARTAARHKHTHTHTHTHTHVQRTHTPGNAKRQIL
jgi:hypothetical protein